MTPLPAATREAAPLTTVSTSKSIIIIGFNRSIWQLDLKTSSYSELTPLPEEAYVDKFVFLRGQFVGSGGENKLEGPRRRSEWTFIGRFLGN
jgi:hypothetical protein